MNIGQLLYDLPDNLKKNFRKQESLRKKIIECKWSLKFNKFCVNEELLPNYSYFNLHDQAAINTNFTCEYRWYLVNRQIDEKCQLLKEHERDLEITLDEIKNYNYSEEDKRRVQHAIDQEIQNSDLCTETRILKKLNKLYRGNVILKKDSDSFINLSKYELTATEKEFLNLGLNYHLQQKYDKLTKETEIEALYQNLLRLEEQNKIEIDPRLPDQLTSEATKHRNVPNHNSLPSHLRQAAKSLRQNKDIVIKRADKSQTYVIMDKEDYERKLNSILSDSTKFKKISKDPTNSVKQKANKLISTLNAAQQDKHLPKIVGDYKPGYIYGTAKTHKPNNPLRPIISQIPTSTYELSKSINSIISPYIPNQFSLTSSDDFIDLIHSNTAKGMIASLDVESLFTNVPIHETVEIIIKQSYNHKNLPPPKMPKNILRELLILCTTESPFIGPNDQLYQQINGVAMGSCLGPTFAAFYMGNLEQEVFSESPSIKPTIYARYVDDVFLLVENKEHLVTLKTIFESRSILKFTYEMNCDNRLPFLDILVDNNNQNKFGTKVYRKSTNTGRCLNAHSECVDRYKNSVIYSYLNRAYKTCQNWKDFHEELLHIKQILVNNNFSNSVIDKETRKFLQSKLGNKEQNSKLIKIPVYYQNQFHLNYKTEEKIMKDIILKNVKCVQADHRLQLIIYYSNRKTSNLVIKNNLSPPQPLLDHSGVVYEFSCPNLNCKSSERNTTYIGMTQVQLKRRLQQHTNKGSILEHYKTIHSTTLDKETLFNNTSIIARASNRYKLAIKEALLISHKNPIINRQFETFVHTLKLHPHRSIPVQPTIHESPNVQTLQGSTPNHSSQLDVSLSPLTLALTPMHRVSPNIATRINRLISNGRNNDANLENENASQHLNLRTRTVQRSLPPLAIFSP